MEIFSRDASLQSRNHVSSPLPAPRSQHLTILSNGELQRYMMKTSRISRDTAKYTRALSVNAAATSTRSSERRDGRGSTKAAASPLTRTGKKPQPLSSSSVKREPDEGDIDSSSDSPLSSVPPSPNPTAPSKKRKRTTPTIAPKTTAVLPPIEPPPRWRELYDCAKEIRAEIEAPVDTMGCSRLAERWRSPKVYYNFNWKETHMLTSPGPTLPNPRRSNALPSNPRYRHRSRNAHPPNNPTPPTHRPNPHFSPHPHP